MSIPSSVLKSGIQSIHQPDSLTLLHTMTRNSRKINVITLGCSKNLVDSEVLLRQIDAQGIEVVHDAQDSDAGTVIINTCGFIQDAKQESIDTILEYVREKQEGRLERLFVMGCLSERYKSELAKEIPEVDQYFGVNDIRQIISQLGGDLKKELLGERILTTPTHYAYLRYPKDVTENVLFVQYHSSGDDSSPKALKCSSEKQNCW